MSSNRETLNRFPLFGLFCYRAALRAGKSDRQARLLGYSMAVLYAIFKSQAQRRREGEEKTEKRKLPAEASRAETGLVAFGGHQFLVIKDDAGHVRKSVVGNEVHEPAEYEKRVIEKFPQGWHDRLAKKFDRYLQPHQPSELKCEGAVYELYKAWRDDCKVGRNRVDLEALEDWIDDHV